MLKRLSLAILALGFISNAHAGALIEPYLGYHLGTYKAGGPNEDFSGVDFGARVGFQQLGFMAGLDYMTGSYKDDSNPKNDVTPSSLGVFFGYEFPILIRVYGVYGFLNDLKFEHTGFKQKWEGSSNLKLGVGFTALPFLCINVEYMMGTYDKVNDSSVTNDLKTSQYGVSVSLPFVF